MLNIITYIGAHRKTYDTLCLLKASGHHDVSVFATQMAYKKTFVPLIEHRPENNAPPTRLVCENFGYAYAELTSYRELNAEGTYLICGANVIPEDVVNRLTIINAHPGYIPNVRGLDALKWAIAEGEPIGVTTHKLGNRVDAGEVIERRVIPVLPGDTFHRLAQRVYETEVQMLVGALTLLDNPREFTDGAGYPIRARMPKAKETLLLKQFEDRKNAGKSQKRFHPRE